VRSYSDETLARFAAGEIDELDAIEVYLDEGTIALCPGIVGSFSYGGLTYVGARGLVQLDVPDAATGNDSQPITVTLAETYTPPDSDVPVNIFDNGTAASIDDIAWQGKTVVLAIFYLDSGGTILDREQVDVMQIDGASQQIGEDGRLLRVFSLERPDIIQRDIEAKTMDAALQALIDPDDRGMEHAGETVSQDFYFGRLPPDTVTTQQGKKG